MNGFNQFITEAEQKLPRQSPAAQTSPAEADSAEPISTPQPSQEPAGDFLAAIIEQMIVAKVITESAGIIGLPDLASTLARRIADVHAAMMTDPQATIQVRRLSYQNMALAFLTMLSLGANGAEWQSTKGR
jgi:hypothetical protein